MSFCCSIFSIASSLCRKFCCCAGSKIPQGCGFRRQPLLVDDFTDDVEPLVPADFAEHPFLAPNGQNGLHGDSYCTAAHPKSGPIGSNPQVTSRSLGLIGGECATVVFDSKGRLITVSGSFRGFKLLLLDPDTLQTLATYDLPKREGDSILDIEASLNDTSGGAYFHLDHQDRPIICNAERKILVFEIKEQASGKVQWEVVETHDLNAVLSDDEKVTDVIPDWSGLLWFVTRAGIVGTVNRTTKEIQTKVIDGEEIQNALAVASDGIYLVSDFALYRFEADKTDAPVWTWREAYERATNTKPGSINLGSGTTPTLLGDDLVAIVDNADKQVNICVYLRAKDVATDRLIVKQPIFEAGKSATECSLIGYENSLISVNNFGYTTPFNNPRTAQGVVRIDIASDRKSHSVVWNSEEAPQTALPKLSVGNGLIYIYTRRKETRRYKQAWYLTAIDYRTGKTVLKILCGTGILYNSNYGPITIGPNGTAYVGILNGIVAVRDGKPDEPERSQECCDVLCCC